jgi:DNA excision repair protein ERCC-2
VYEHLVCQPRGLAEIGVSLVYFDIRSPKETLLTQTHTHASLEAFFNEQRKRFIDWAAHEQAHRIALNAALTALKFPYGRLAGSNLMMSSTER